jgi:hypothetical protein
MLSSAKMTTEVTAGPAIKFKGLAWIHDNPTTLACRSKTSSAATIVHGRRSHKKSRLGCGNCKRRRAKCDEAKPKCQKCVQQRILCDYLKPPTPPDTESGSPPEDPWSSAVTASMTSDIVEARLRTVVGTSKRGSLRSTPSTRNAEGSLIEVLHHFEHIASSTIGTPELQQTMRTTVLSLVQDSPFLMHAILAFSAHHLHMLRPDDKYSRTTATYHSQIALHLYPLELAGELTVSNVNSIIAACFLVTAIVFIAGGSPSASFVFSDDPKEAEWLVVVAGLSVLLSRADTKALISRSIWMPMFTGNTHCMFPELASGKTGLPEMFVELCHIEDYSTADNNPYHGELRLLTQVMAMKANKETFAKLIQFPCRTDPAFNVLIREKDPVALLMLAYWFAKILEIDFWWLGPRARSELYAICSYLDGWPDERFQPLLQYPMKACGYVPIDLDMIETYVFGM